MHTVTTLIKSWLEGRLQNLISSYNKKMGNQNPSIEEEQPVDLSTEKGHTMIDKTYTEN